MTTLIEEDLAEILQAVADAFTVKKEDIIARKRPGWIINPRFTTYHLLRQRGWSYEQVAKACGGRDHGAIMHGIKVLEGRLNYEKQLGKAVEKLRGNGYQI